MALFLAHPKPHLFFFFFFFFKLESYRIRPILRGTARGMEGYIICGRKQHHGKLAHLPEHPQKPVINGAKDPGHGDGLYSRRTRARTREKGGRISNIYVSDRGLSVCVLSIWRETDDRECGKKQRRSTSRSKPRISSQYAKEEESVLSQNDLDMVSTSGPNKQQEFCNQHAQAGFLGGMLRDGEKEKEILQRLKRWSELE